MEGSWLLLIAMAFVLGIRHGIDLDHLATIDAMTRAVRENKRLSKFVGCLFSLGHGFIVTLLSVIIGSGIMHSQIPQWFDELGRWISIFFLFTFGLANLWNVWFNSHQSFVPTGIRSFLSQKITAKNCNPIVIACIGALFAFSFDTISQVALFSLSASVVAGWLFSGVLGLTFMLGMMVMDGFNGFLVSALIQRADGVSLIISRVTGLAIASFSLVVGMISLSEMV